MNSVLIVGHQRELSEILREALYDAGYTVTVYSDTSLALAFLQAATTLVVIIVHSHGGASQEWEPILAAIAGLPPHAYLLMSTNPQTAPQQWNPHTQAFVSVVPMPFDLDVLLARVADAVSRLNAGPSSQGVEPRTNCNIRAD